MEPRTIILLITLMMKAVCYKWIITFIKHFFEIYSDIIFPEKHCVPQEFYNQNIFFLPTYRTTQLLDSTTCNSRLKYNPWNLPLYNYLQFIEFKYFPRFIFSLDILNLRKLYIKFHVCTWKNWILLCGRTNTVRYNKQVAFYMWN